MRRDLYNEMRWGATLSRMGWVRAEQVARTFSISYSGACYALRLLYLDGLIERRTRKSKFQYRVAKARKG